MGPAYLAAYNGQIFNMAGFGMRERGFNTIISGMIVSHYSAVASSTGMREGCLFRGGRDVCCCSWEVDHFVDYLNFHSLTSPLFLVPKYDKC